MAKAKKKKSDVPETTKEKAETVTLESSKEDFGKILKETETLKELISKKIIAENDSGEILELKNQLKEERQAFQKLIEVLVQNFRNSIISSIKESTHETTLVIERSLQKQVQEKLFSSFLKEIESKQDILESLKTQVKSRDKVCLELGQQLAEASQEIQILSEKLETESKLNEQAVESFVDRIHELEVKDSRQSAKLYAHKLMEDNVNLRPHGLQLLEGSSKEEVDRICETAKATEKLQINEVFYGDGIPKAKGKRFCGGNIREIEGGEEFLVEADGTKQTKKLTPEEERDNHLAGIKTG